jgi:hypothetical protein
MTRLILTSLSGLSLERSGRADVVVVFSFRFVWGPPPSSNELAAYLGARSDKQAQGTHWSDFFVRKSSFTKARRDLGLVEFCKQCETVELWFDPDPNDQLQLIWLLDHFSSHPEIVARLRLRIVDYDLLTATPDELGRWKVMGPEVTRREFETASAAWRAYRAPTPEPCFSLLATDLSALPMLRQALSDLLEELPFGATGLGATEMRLLELIAIGVLTTNGLFYLRGLRQRRVFSSFEIGYLLEGLAHGPRAAVAGLDDKLRTLDRENYRERDEAFKRSQPSLTKFGKAILAHKEDFSRHNPIHRWWGSTQLSSDRLWRWNTALVAP